VEGIDVGTVRFSSLW